MMRRLIGTRNIPDSCLPDEYLTSNILNTLKELKESTDKTKGN